MMRKYVSLQPSWCAEMHGYVFAAAELGIKVTFSLHFAFLQKPFTLKTLKTP